MKLLFITCICFLFIGKTFGQVVARATISVTVVNPVGAELTSDINKENILIKNLGITPSYVKDFKPENRFTIKIIGGEFSHSTTVENDKPVVTHNNENEDVVPVINNLLFTRITVNFD